MYRNIHTLDVLNVIAVGGPAYIYIYIYIERENSCVYTYTYIYIYILYRYTMLFICLCIRLVVEYGWPAAHRLGIAF